MHLIGIGNYQDYPSNVFCTGCCCEACITKGCEQPLPPSSNAWNFPQYKTLQKNCSYRQLLCKVILVDYLSRHYNKESFCYVLRAKQNTPRVQNNIPINQPDFDGFRFCLQMRLRMLTFLLTHHIPFEFRGMVGGQARPMNVRNDRSHSVHPHYLIVYVSLITYET